MGDVAGERSGGWWWLDLETGAALQATETTPAGLGLEDGEWQLTHVSSGGRQGPGLPQVICYGSLDELRDMVRRWLGDDLYVEQSLPEAPAARVEAARARSVVSRDETGAVTGYRGPRSSPWAVPLPKTVAEARSLGERVPVGVEKPATVEAFLQYLIGVWVRCRSDDISELGDGRDALGAPGLEIDPDGRWAALLETDSELHRSTGWGTEGRWTVIDIAGMNPATTFQLDLETDGGGGLNAIAAFATSPPLMRLEVPNSAPPGVRPRQVRLGPGQRGINRLHLHYVRLDQFIPGQRA